MSSAFISLATGLVAICMLIFVGFETIPHQITFWGLCVVSNIWAAAAAIEKTIRHDQ